MEAFIVGRSWARVLRAWRFEAGTEDGRSGPLDRMLEHEGGCLSFLEKVYFSSLKYCKSVVFIPHVSFGANQSFN